MNDKFDSTSRPLSPDTEGSRPEGSFERVLRSGNFAVTADLAPPNSADAEELYARARVFDGYVDVMNATDGSGVNCHMSSVGVCSLLAGVGYTTTMQVSCRDRNRLAIQGDVLGAVAMGVNNVLCLTGDSVTPGEQFDAKPVFDLDCMSLLGTIRQMRDDACFLGGRQLSNASQLFLGTTVNPCIPAVESQAFSLAEKIEAGAQFVQTQICFDLPRLKRFLSEVEDLGLHEHCFILAGVGPLTSVRSAMWLRDHVPGVYIPDEIIERLAKATRPRQEGKRICMELIQQIRDMQGVSGVHLMAYRQEESVAEIIDASGVLGGRVPWYPGQAVERQSDFSKRAII